MATGIFLAAVTVALPAAAEPVERAAVPFRIGMVVAGNEPVIDGVSEITAAFSAALDLPVEVIAARDFTALTEAHIAGRIDYAVYSAQAYAAAYLRCGCLQPVASPLGQNGAVGVRSVLVRRDVHAMPQKIALGPEDSLTGRLAPLAFWPLAADFNISGNFTETATLSDAETLFLDGSADGFFGWVPAWPEEAAPVGGSLMRLRAAGLGASDYDVFWQSEVLYNGPHAVRVDMPAEQFDALRRMLVSLGPDQPSLRLALSQYGNGFSAASHEDYSSVLDALASLHWKEARE